MKTLLFVSKTYGAQDFIMFDEDKKVAIKGNSQASKVAPVNVKYVPLKEVRAKINQLENHGVKIIDSRSASYDELHQIMD